MSQAMDHASIDRVIAGEEVVQSKSDLQPGSARRPAVRAAVLLAAAIALTFLGMTLSYAFVRLLET
jgi:hypothetical protein